MGKPKGEKTASPAEGKIKQVPGAVRKKRKTTFGDSLAATDSKHKFGGSSDKFPKDPSEPKAKQPAKKKKQQPTEKTKKAGKKVGVDVDEAGASSSSDSEDDDIPTSACPCTIL